MTSPESLVGTELNEFLLVEYIARGAMGLVYKAKDTKMDRPVALKLVSKTTDLAPAMGEARKRLKNEAQAAGRLSHPNIVTVHGWGETEEFLYICMEYVAGRTLSEILHEKRVLAAGEALPLFEQILMALEASAAEHIVHRDIKPTNVMVMKENRVKVMDFGIAKMPSMHLTVTGTVLGTPYYMSPEQISGQDVDIRSDLFSVGAVLYQALTGQRPFEGESTVVLTYKIMHTDPIPPRVLNIHISAPLENLCLKALVKDPRARYQTPTEMLKDLRAIMRMEPVFIDELDMEATRIGPSASGPAVPHELTPQASSYGYRSTEQRDIIPPAREVRETFQPGKGGALPQKSGMPLRTVLVASTLTVITIFGVVVAVRQYQKAPQPPGVTSKEEIKKAEPLKPLPSSIPETPSPVPPPATVQPKISVETLIRQAKALTASNPSDARKLLETAISLDPNHFEAVFELAKLLDQVKDFPAAIEQYQNALRLNPKDTGVHFQLASLYLSQGNYDQALGYFESCRALSPPNKDEVLVDMGIIYAKKNDPMQAIGLFQEALAFNQRNEPARKHLKESTGALVSLAKEQLPTDPATARKMLEKALSLDPNQYEASVELARLLDQKKDYQAAIEQYQNALRLNPKDAGTHFQLASLYLSQGNYDQALKNFESCKALSPSNKDEVLVNMGIIYAKKNDPMQAVGLFKEALDLNPGNETGRMHLKESTDTLVSQAKEQSQANPAAARKMLEKALSLDPNRYEASVELARLLDQKKDYQAAIAQYQNALRLNPSDAGVHFQLASLYLSQGNYDQALKTFESCKALSPSNKDEVLVNEGIIYAKKSDPAQAVGLFQEALELNPANEPARKHLKESMGTLVSQAKEQLKANPANARKMLEKALSLDPNQYEASLELARLLDQKKDYRAAAEQYENALRINSRSAEACVGLASVYMNQGDYDQARANFELCKTLAPVNLDEVLTNLGIIHARKNNPSQAQSYFKEALDLNKKNETARRLLTESINQMVAEAKKQLQTNPEMAQKMLEGVIALDPGHFEAQFQLARLLTFQKDYNAAILQYQKALSLNKQSPDVYFNLGYVYLVQADYDRAIQNYEACMKLSPAYRDEVLTNLGISYYKKNNISKAQSVFKDAIKLNPNNESAKMYLKSLGG